MARVEHGVCCGMLHACVNASDVDAHMDVSKSSLENACHDKYPSRHATQLSPIAMAPGQLVSRKDCSYRVGYISVVHGQQSELVRTADIRIHPAPAPAGGIADACESYCHSPSFKFAGLSVACTCTCVQL